MKKTNKKKLFFVLFMIGGVGSVSFYAQTTSDTQYYYKAQNVLGENLIIGSNLSDRDEALEEYKGAASDDGVEGESSYTNEDNITTIIRTDASGKETCYVDKENKEEQEACNEGIFDELKQLNKEQDQKNEFKSFTDYSAKVEDGIMTCYKGEEEVSCDDPNFTYNEEEDRMVFSATVEKY